MVLSPGLMEPSHLFRSWSSRPLALLAAAALIGAAPALAQPVETVVEEVAPVERAAGPNLLLVNPGDLLNGIFSAEYERVLAPWFGVVVGLSVWGLPGIFPPPAAPGARVVALGPDLGARFHPFRDAPGGYWVGATASFDAVLSRSDGPLSRPWSWGLGITTGYTFIVERTLSFQVGVGGRFNDYGDRLVWSPRLVLALGSAF
jgi:hypothetical protein